MKEENKLTVYEKALELYKAMEDKSFVGFCYLLTDAILIVEHNTTMDLCKNRDYVLFSIVWDFVIDNLGISSKRSKLFEISNYNPHNDQLFWFEKNDYTSRIEILEEAIKTVKDEQRIN